MMVNSYTDANGVYRNKLGIVDAAQLKVMEYNITASRSREILDQGALVNIRSFNLEHQKAIHQHLFQDIYEWAGKPRTVPSSKGMGNGMVSVFANPDEIVPAWRELENKTQAFINAKGLTFEQKHEALAEIFIEANHIHPFPEGNGRSLQVFMKKLAREQDIDLNYSKTNSPEWNRARAISGTHGKLFEKKYLIPIPSNPEPIKKIFSEIACQLSRDSEKNRIAPRHDLDKSQAQMHVAATQRVAENLEALKKNPALAGMSAQALERLAYYRGILQEDVKREIPEVQQAALAKFDRVAESPAFLERLEKNDQEATKERAAPKQRQERDDGR
jgi:cell filamentation protein